MTFYSPPTVIPVYAVLAGVGIFLTSLRFWVRLSYTKLTLGLDDLFIILAVIVCLICTAIQFHNALKGTAGESISPHHDEDERAIVAHKTDFAMTVIEKLAFGATKLSLLFFYRRIFGVWPSFRRLNYILIATVGAWTLALALADLLLCGGRIWLQWALDQTLARRGCGDKGVLLVAFAATSVLTDGLVLALPLVYLRRLQMAGRKKVAVGVTFLLGTM